MPVSTYDGADGITFRDDFAGLNLTTVPKVLIECGNMQNVTDAAMLTSEVVSAEGCSCAGTRHYELSKLIDDPAPASWTLFPYRSIC